MHPASLASIGLACSPGCSPVALLWDTLFCDFKFPQFGQLACCLKDITPVSNGRCDFFQECRGSYGHPLVQATSSFSQIARVARAHVIASLRNKSQSPCLFISHVQGCNSQYLSHWITPEQALLSLHLAIYFRPSPFLSYILICGRPKATDITLFSKE